MTIDVAAIRNDFPILHRKVNGKPLVYFDNAATSQTPKAVIDALVNYYSNTNANIHRGVHALIKAGWFDPPKDSKAFQCGKTHGCSNLRTPTAHMWLRAMVPYWAGDELLVSAMEHHSNIVPWQMMAEKTGSSSSNSMLPQEFWIWKPIKVAIYWIGFVNHVSNALGTVNPIADIIDLAHTQACPDRWGWLRTHSCRCTGFGYRLLCNFCTQTLRTHWDRDALRERSVQFRLIRGGRNDCRGNLRKNNLCRSAP